MKIFNSLYLCLLTLVFSFPLQALAPKTDMEKLKQARYIQSLARDIQRVFKKTDFENSLTQLGSEIRSLEVIEHEVSANDLEKIKDIISKIDRTWKLLNRLLKLRGRQAAEIFGRENSSSLLYDFRDKFSKSMMLLYAVPDLGFKSSMFCRYAKNSFNTLTIYLEMIRRFAAWDKIPPGLALELDESKGEPKEIYSRVILLQKEFPDISEAA